MDLAITNISLFRRRVFNYRIPVFRHLEKGAKPGTCEMNISNPIAFVRELECNLCELQLQSLYTVCEQPAIHHGWYSDIYVEQWHQVGWRGANRGGTESKKHTGNQAKTEARPAYTIVVVVGHWSHSRPRPAYTYSGINCLLNILWPNLISSMQELPKPPPSILQSNARPQTTSTHYSNYHTQYTSLSEWQLRNNWKGQRFCLIFTRTSRHPTIHWRCKKNKTILNELAIAAPYFRRPECHE